MRTLIAGKLQDDNFDLRFRFLDRDGHYRWISMRGRIERDRHGTLLRQGGTLRDISVDVAQEEERAEASARLEALVNAMPFAVWGRSGPDLRIIHQNAESIAWWGDLLGRGVEDMPPGIARVWRAQIAEAMAGSVVKHRTQYPVENRMRVVDEIIAPVIVDGEATGVVGVCRDVTDEHRQQEFEALLTDVTAEFASRSTATLDAALVTALERIGRFLGATISTLCEVSDDNWVSVTHWWADPASARNRLLATEIDGAPVAVLVDQLKANQPVVVRSQSDLREGSAARAFVTLRQLESFVVVDDELGVRGLVRNVLERAGLTVVLADDGRQGVEAFRAIANDVRLVLVDLTMPGLDGREALAAMRQIRPDVRAILMSGYTHVDVADAAAHAFLQKPFTPAVLRAVVRKVLGED